MTPRHPFNNPCCWWMLGRETPTAVPFDFIPRLTHPSLEFFFGTYEDALIENQEVKRRIQQRFPTTLFA